jgi:phosphoribosylamine--glycine ligase
MDALLGFALREVIGLTIIGPEGPLVAGIVDRFAAAGRRCFGPVRAAARLEGSKAFTKDFLQRHRIPTAGYATFTAANFDAGFVRAQRLPLVVKADGLAAGKGVVICESHESALAAAAAMLGGSFGAAGSTIVVEEYLRGEEVSFCVVAHDSQVLALATSQDHKRRDDGDLGPNTGGMGAYSPAPVVTPSLHERIMREVIEPTLRGLRDDGTAYSGLLYAGLMIAGDGTPNVLEFNCRFGDPESQPILMRLQSDLTELCEAAIDGTLDRAAIRWDSRAALGVVMACGGYPDSYSTGDAITGLDAAARLPGKVFHAGTSLREGQVVTAGGRVLCAVGLGDTVGAAQRQAYDLVRTIGWERVQYRHDIGHRAVAREAGSASPW